MATAKASVLERFHAPLQIREYPLPRVLPRGAVLVKTEMAGICGTDVHLWKGELPISLPVILGHETVGRVVEVGEGLDRDWSGQELARGDRVVWNSTVSCGRCYYCLTKRQPTRCPERRAYGIGYRCDRPPHFLGGYAEYHYLCPGVTLFKLPEDLPTESVIGAGCALITALHGIERVCGERGPGADPGALPSLPGLWRENVVVQGAGPVGISAVAVARQAGASRVLVIGGPHHRLALARRFGADETIDLGVAATAAARVAAVRELTGGHGADVVVECVGHPSVVGEGMEMCRDGGKYLLLGHYCDAGSVSWNPHLVTRKQLQVFGSWSSEPRHLRLALDFLRKERRLYPFASMVSHRFALAEANQALELTAAWQSAKSVIVP